MATTKKTRSRLPADQRRELILVAGAGLFAERGYEGATLEDIATAAGVTKPILYRHFRSKKDLYLALLVRHSDDMPTFIQPIPIKSTGGVDLWSLLDPWFGYARANPHGWQMLFRDAGGDEDIRAYRSEVRDRARLIIAGFLGSVGAEIETAELLPLAELLRAGLAGLVLWWAEHPDVARADVVAAAVRLLEPLLDSGAGSGCSGAGSG